MEPAWPWAVRLPEPKRYLLPGVHANALARALSGREKRERNCLLKVIVYMPAKVMWSM